MINISKWKNKFGLIGMSDGTYWEGGDALHKTGVIAGLKSLGADVNYSLADFIKALEATATGEAGKHKRSHEHEWKGHWKSTRDQYIGLVMGLQWIRYQVEAHYVRSFIVNNVGIGFDIWSPTFMAFTHRCIGLHLPKFYLVLGDLLFILKLLLRTYIFKTKETSTRQNDIWYAIMASVKRKEIYTPLIVSMLRRDCIASHGSIQAVLDVYYSGDAPPINEIARPIINRYLIKK